MQKRLANVAKNVYNKKVELRICNFSDTNFHMWENKDVLAKH